MNLKVVAFNPNFARDFHDLNIEWLQTYFYVEPYDNEVLSKPRAYIIDKGGEIFFILRNSTVVGTVALMPTADPEVMELTKMAVHPEARGQKIGQKLIYTQWPLSRIGNKPVVYVQFVFFFLLTHLKGSLKLDPFDLSNTLRSSKR